MPVRMRPWAQDAERAIDARLRGQVTLRQIEGLRQTKVAMLEAFPERPNPRDTDARRVLTSQVEALGLILAAYRGQPYDQERLAQLALAEAWRTKQHAELVKVWDSLARS